jgi:hypothetical protein
MTTKMKTAILSLAGVIIAALITAYATMHTQSTPAVSQSANQGNNVSVPGSGNAVQANSGSGSSTMITNPTTITYNNCFNNTYVTNVFKNTATPGHMPAKGDTCYIDTANKVIHFRPRSGEWNKPFVSIPDSEITAVAPRLSLANQSSLLVRNGTDTLDGELLHTMSPVAGTASAQTEITLHYDRLPSILYFGDLSGPIFKATRREQPAYSKN